MREPHLDEDTFRIVLFGLKEHVEFLVPWLTIHSTSIHPLPPSIVGGEVVVAQGLLKVSLAVFEMDV